MIDDVLTSISASKSATLFAGLSFLRGLAAPPRPRRAFPRTAPVLVRWLRIEWFHTKISKVTYLAPSAGAAAGAGATRAANEAAGAGRVGSTTISIFMGRSARTKRVGG